MAEEKLSGLSAILDQYKKYYPEVSFRVIGNDHLAKNNPDLEITLSELIGNCVERFNQPAKNVQIVFSKHSITVSDEVRYSKDEVKAILDNIKNEHPHTTKPPDDDGSPNGGIGIIASRRHLANIGGELFHFERDQKIVARIILK